jgi:transposase-like protein
VGSLVIRTAHYCIERTFDASVLGNYILDRTRKGTYTLKSFKSLSDMRHAFPTEDACINHFRTLRWAEADKIACPHCGVIGKHYTLKNNTHKCRDCLKKFTVRNGTIFEDSKVSLMKWFEAIFLMTSHKKGISSMQLAKDVGVTQKTAWFMLHRIRNAAMTVEFNAPLRGTVEIDECYVGPKTKFQHADKRPGKSGNHASEAKKIVLAMAQRGGDLRLAHIPDTQLKTTVANRRCQRLPNSAGFTPTRVQTTRG